MKIGKTEESLGATALEKKEEEERTSLEEFINIVALKLDSLSKECPKKGLSEVKLTLNFFFKDTHSSCMKNLKTKSRKKGLVFNYIQPDSLPHNKNMYKITGKS